MKYEEIKIRWKKWLLIFGICPMFCAGCGPLSAMNRTEEADRDGFVKEILSGEEEQSSENRAQTGKIERAQEEKSGGTSFSQKEGSAAGQPVDRIYVHICGCVKEPGLYMVDRSFRVGEAVRQAGGFTKEADQSAINQAAVLEDGMQLYVPSKQETREGAEKSSGLFGDDKETGKEASGKSAVSEKKDPLSETAGTERININEASLLELTSLSGIGQTRAESIVAYREKNGPFSSIEDIKNVSGIGDGIFEKIKDCIEV